MKRLYVIEDLCNGCRLCQTFCSSLGAGVFGEEARIRVLKVPGDERDIPLLDCTGCCLRPLYGEGPTCVTVCPTGALIYASPQEAAEMRLQWEAARQAHSLFKVIAPWKWPFPWRTDVQSPSDQAGGDNLQHSTFDLQPGQEVSP